MNRPYGTAVLTDQEIAACTIGTLMAVAVGVAMGAAHLAEVFAHGPRPADNPIVFVGQLARGRFAWTAAASAYAAVLGALAVATGICVITALVRRKPPTHVDRRALHLTRSQEIARYTTKPPAHLYPAPGLPIGKVLPAGRQLVRATWEDQVIHIAGTRTGKTTSTAIPAVLAAPGAVVVTSNKRDIVDATRGVRESPERGPIWLFDPQALAGGQPTWWWDPLSYVTNVRTARQLATIWATSGRDADTRPDPYFDRAGQELLSMLLLAAARGRRPITDVYEWVANPDDDTPRELLAEHGDWIWHRGLTMTQRLPEKQRAGVYGTAATFIAWAADPEVLAWITDPGGFRPAFDPHVFVEGANATLYSISREGEGSSAPLTTALTAAVLEAAEQRASTFPGGRLPVPLTAILDEAANICRWHQLPNIVSHFGSRGIVLVIILQSWSQGIRAWGQHGMRAMWGAVNLRVYGGGVADTEFLKSLSDLCGQWDRPMRSRSHSYRMGPSTSLAHHREEVFDVASLGALPPGRALVLMSGARPVLVAAQPWMTGPDAESVRASIARFEPGSTPAPVSDPASFIPEPDWLSEEPPMA